MRVGRFLPIVKVFKTSETFCSPQKKKFFVRPLFFAADTFLIHCEGTEKVTE